MNKKNTSLLLFLFISFFVSIPVYSASIKRNNTILKYNYSNSFEKGTETVYYFKDKYCIRRYTEDLNSARSAEDIKKVPILAFINKEPKTANRVVVDPRYIYEINDLEKTATRMDIELTKISELKDEREKEFQYLQIKLLTEKIEKLVKSNPLPPMEHIKNSKKVTYFGKPCRMFTLMGAKFIYWEDILFFREVLFDDKTKEVLEINSIDMNAKIDLSVFEIPSYYKIKDVSKEEMISLITKVTKIIQGNSILSEIKNNEKMEPKS